MPNEPQEVTASPRRAPDSPRPRLLGGRPGRGLTAAWRTAGTPARARRERALPCREGQWHLGAGGRGTIWPRTWRRCAARVVSRALPSPGGRAAGSGAAPRLRGGQNVGQLRSQSDVIHSRGQAGVGSQGPQGGLPSRVGHALGPWGDRSWPPALSSHPVPGVCVGQGAGALEGEAGGDVLPLAAATTNLLFCLAKSSPRWLWVMRSKTHTCAGPAKGQLSITERAQGSQASTARRT